ncbi:MAG: hypothetical protein ACLU37_11985 [Collinsella sp.]
MAMDILMRLGVSSASIKRLSRNSPPRTRTRSVRSPAPALVVLVRACRSLAARMPLSKGGGTDTLKQFATNLTQKARDGELDPVIGREKEVQRMMEILSRRIRTTRLSWATPAWARRPSSRA